MSLLRGRGRGRAFLRFLFAVAWLIAAYFLSEKAAHGFSHGAAFPLIRDLFEIFLLILGYSYMEMAWDNTREPLRAMGLAAGPDAVREFTLGTAMGWGMVTVIFLVIALAGRFYVRLWGSPRAWELFVLQILILAAGSLAAEIAFRGYPFQKLIQSTGPFTATILAGIFFALLRLQTPGTTPAAMWVSGVAAVLLSVAYLRTGALWLCWGLHFSWVVSIGVLFGQPLAGSRRASSVIQTYADGPTWLTGSEYGPEASVITLIVLWIGLYLLFKVTRELAGKYTHPELKPAGIAMGTVHSAPAAAPFSGVSAPTQVQPENVVAPITPNQSMIPESYTSTSKVTEPVSNEPPSLLPREPLDNSANR